MQLNIRQIKKIIILVIGVTVLLTGLALLFLPGPGILILFLGLLVLTTEFIWAKRLMKKVKSYNPLRKK